MIRLILASGSPRRRELLERMGVEFEVRTPSIPELTQDDRPAWAPGELALANAHAKAGAVTAEIGGDRWVLGADTVVALNGLILGKPVDQRDARRMLSLLSGQTHEVWSAVALIHPTSGEEQVLTERSRVTFHPLSAEAIDRYLERVHVLDKAGAYAVQSERALIIAAIDGSESNVMGLPCEALARLWKVPCPNDLGPAQA